MRVGDFCRFGDRVGTVEAVGLRYETTADQLRHVLVGLRKLLRADSRVDPVPARVRFVGFGAHSLDLEIFAYIRTRDFDEFLAIREDLLLRIMDCIAASGSGFAFPSQTLYAAKDTGLDPERSRAAIEEARRWREQAEPLPG